MAAKKTWKVPLRKDGTLMEYASWDGALHQPSQIAEPDVEWELRLTFRTYSRGRSAATIKGLDSKGRSWPMKLKEFMSMLGQVVLERGVMTEAARFGVAKQGQNYSLSYRGPV